MNIKIDNDNYIMFASESVKRCLLRNKISAIDLLTPYTKKIFSKKGNCSIKKIGEENISITNISVYDFDEEKITKCFILHSVGNYTELKPVLDNKWSVKLECGHNAIIDDTVDTICKDHKVKCFLCEKANA